MNTLESHEGSEIQPYVEQPNWSENGNLLPNRERNPLARINLPLLTNKNSWLHRVGSIDEIGKKLYEQYVNAFEVELLSGSLTPDGISGCVNRLLQQPYLTVDTLHSFKSSREQKIALTLLGPAPAVMLPYEQNGIQIEANGEIKEKYLFYQFGVSLIMFNPALNGESGPDYSMVVLAAGRKGDIIRFTDVIRNPRETNIKDKLQFMNPVNLKVQLKVHSPRELARQMVQDCYAHYAEVLNYCEDNEIPEVDRPRIISLTEDAVEMAIWNVIRMPLPDRGLPTIGQLLARDELVDIVNNSREQYPLTEMVRYACGALGIKFDEKKHGKGVQKSDEGEAFMGKRESKAVTWKDILAEIPKEYRTVVLQNVEAIAKAYKNVEAEVAKARDGQINAEVNAQVLSLKEIQAEQARTAVDIKRETAQLEAKIRLSEATGRVIDKAQTLLTGGVMFEFFGEDVPRLEAAIAFFQDLGRSYPQYLELAATIQEGLRHAQENRLPRLNLPVLQEQVEVFQEFLTVFDQQNNLLPSGSTNEER